jgi:hypothetical protein
MVRLLSSIVRHLPAEVEDVGRARPASLLLARNDVLSEHVQCSGESVTGNARAVAKVHRAHPLARLRKRGADRRCVTLSLLSVRPPPLLRDQLCTVYAEREPAFGSPSMGTSLITSAKSSTVSPCDFARSCATRIASPLLALNTYAESLAS